MTREEMLMKLYWKLWVSVDFEDDFDEDWGEVYRKFKMGDHYDIPLQVIEMCFQYLTDWEKEG